MQNVPNALDTLAAHLNSLSKQFQLLTLAVDHQYIYDRNKGIVSITTTWIHKTMQNSMFRAKTLRCETSKYVL